MEIEAVCRLCASRCGAVLEVEGGRVVGVKGDSDHPVSRGWMCSMGRAAVAKTYIEGTLDPKRLLYVPAGR